MGSRTRSRVIFIDFNRTLYDPEKDCLISGAKDALEKFRALGYILVLIGKADPNVMQKIDHLNIREYFTEIILDKEKNAKQFSEVLQRNKAKSSLSYVIGNRVKEEIAIGNELNIKTIWFNGEASEPPENAIEIPYLAGKWETIIRYINV